MPLPLPPARMGAGEARNGSRDIVPCGSRAAPWKESPWIEKIISFGVNRQDEQRKRLPKGRTFPIEAVGKSTLGKIRQYIATGIRIPAQPAYRPYCVDTRVLLATTVLHKRSLSAFLRVPLDLNTISPNRLPSHGIVLTIVPPLAG